MLPKPESRRRAKARRDRKESAVIARVRNAVYDRDGYCRIGRDWRLRALLGRCDGWSEWAHIGEKRRSHTRGMDPEVRHDSAGSMMLCHRHHQDGSGSYDRHGFEVEPLTERGADGPLRFVRRDGVVVDEAH